MSKPKAYQISWFDEPEEHNYPAAESYLTLLFDVYLMLIFGVIGYAFKKLGYPLAPLVLALVLGDRAEENFRNAIKGSQGDLSIFFSNALVGGLTTLALLLLFWPLIRALLRAVQGRRAS